MKILCRNAKLVRVGHPDSTAIHLAARNGHSAVVQHLLACNVDVNTTVGEATHALVCSCFSASLAFHVLAGLAPMLGIFLQNNSTCSKEVELPSCTCTVKLQYNIL